MLEMCGQYFLWEGGGDLEKEIYEEKIFFEGKGLRSLIFFTKCNQS